MIEATVMGSMGIQEGMVATPRGGRTKATKQTGLPKNTCTANGSQPSSPFTQNGCIGCACWPTQQAQCKRRGAHAYPSAV